MASIQSVTISASTTGDLINKQFPLSLLTSANFITTVPISVLGIQLSSSVLNPVVAGLGGVFAGKAVANAEELRVDGSSDIWLSHLYNQSAASVSQTSATGFGDVNLLRIDSGMGLAIYFSAPNDATYLVTATLTLWYSPIL